MRTLIVHTGGLGDFLLACPAIAHIREAGPVELAGYPDRLQLAVAAHLADRAHALDVVDFHTVFDTPSRKLRRFVAPFDRVIVWMRDPENCIARALAACGVPRVDVFPGLPRSGWTRHASEYYLDCLGLPNAAPLRLALEPQPSDLDVVLHPGSGSPTKNWPLEHFKQVANALRAEDRDVTWCLGPAETEWRPEEVTADISIDDRLSCASLVDLAGRLVNARVYIGNDSGITHLAAMLGVPTLAIFGPTDPRIWAPRGPRVTVLQGRPWPDPQQVLHAAQDRLAPARP